MVEAKKEETKRYEFSNKCVYDGQWSGNRRHGHGVFTWPSGARYEGNFKNDRREGPGKILYADKAEYEGEWKGD